MENTIYSLEDLFSTNIFRIPQYQRAYSWDINPHLKAFLDDLRQQVLAQKKNPEKRYFIGTLLLHEVCQNGKKIVFIVDGQQRLTTSVIFMAAALNMANPNDVLFETEKPKVLSRKFIYDSDEECQKFHTIAEDEPFFQSKILKISSVDCIKDSPSSRRLKAASDFFSKEVDRSELEVLVTALKNSKVMVYSVDNPADATQIFELQNDRGKRLSNLEALKSFLMHAIYLNSSNPDDRLSSIQTQFSKIFRYIESLDSISRAPNEDSILAYHCAAFCSWPESAWRNPKQLVKDIMQSLTSDIVNWVGDFVGSLVLTYHAMKNLFDKRDEYTEFSELLILGRMAPFWPLVLKTWRIDKDIYKKNFRKTCRLMEVYAFKGYAISSLRSDSGLPSFYSSARDFNGDFLSLHNHISSMCSWYNLDARFLPGLDNPNLFNDDKNDALYLLWRYENKLRQEPGRQQPLLSWKAFVEPSSYASKFSVEHIAAQRNSIAQKKVEWIEGESKPFSEVALHRLGNLVIDSISPNSAKGKKDYADKLIHLSQNSIYLSQGELINYVLPYNGNPPIWCENAVKKRHKKLIEFVLETWNPDTWHSHSGVREVEADIQIGEEINEINLLED